MCLNLTEKVGLYIYKGAQRRTSLSCALHVASIFYASDLFLLWGIGDRMTALPMEGNGICAVVKKQKVSILIWCNLSICPSSNLNMSDTI